MELVTLIDICVVMYVFATIKTPLLNSSNMAHLEQPRFLLGHGIENPAPGSMKWTVKVSDHAGFPRWDGPTDEAFKRASWQFHGPLETALEKLGVELA